MIGLGVTSGLIVRVVVVVVALSVTAALVLAVCS